MQKAPVWGRALGRGSSGLGDRPCLWVGEVERRALLSLPQRALGQQNHAGLLSSLPSPLGLRTLQTCLSESCPRPHGGDSGSRTTWK